MKVNKYDKGRDVFIHKDGVIFQPTKTNKNCSNCRNGMEGFYIVACKKRKCSCGKNYHCKYFKRKISH